VHAGPNHMLVKIGRDMGPKTYRKVMTDDAPRIMLIVLKRLLTTARKPKLMCARVPGNPSV
jgi:hypothetical protein